MGVPIQTMAYQGLSVSSKVSEMGDLKGREMRPVTSKLPSSCGSSVHRQHCSVRAARFHCTATRVHRLSCKDCIRMVTRRIPIPSTYVTLALFLYLDIHLAASFSRWSASASPAFVVPACLPRFSGQMRCGQGRIAYLQDNTPYPRVALRCDPVETDIQALRFRLVSRLQRRPPANGGHHTMLHEVSPISLVVKFPGHALRKLVRLSRGLGVQGKKKLKEMKRVRAVKRVRVREHTSTEYLPSSTPRQLNHVKARAEPDVRQSSGTSQAPIPLEHGHASELLNNFQQIFDVHDAWIERFTEALRNEQTKMVAWSTFLPIFQRDVCL